MRSLIALALFSLSLSAAAKPVAEPISWNHGGTDFDGYLVYDKGESEKRPGLLMVPNWYGVNDEAIEKAKRLAGDDYVILLVDMYGRGVRPANPAEAGKAAGAVYADTDVLRARINRARSPYSKPRRPKRRWTSSTSAASVSASAAASCLNLPAVVPTWVAWSLSTAASTASSPPKPGRSRRRCWR